MCSNREDLCKKAEWDGRGPQSRQKLMDKLQSRHSFCIAVMFNTVVDLSVPTFCEN
mgnify:CR=1 FL=1